MTSEPTTPTANQQFLTPVNGALIVFGLIMLAALMMMGFSMAQQTQLAAESLRGVESSVNRSERSLTQLQRELLRTQLVLIQNPINSDDLQQQIAFLKVRTNAIDIPVVLNNLSPEVRANAITIIERIRADILPDLEQGLANPETLTNDSNITIFDKISEMERDVNNLATDGEVARKAAAGALTRTTQDLVINAQNLLLGMGIAALIFLVFLLLVAGNTTRFVRQINTTNAEIRTLNTQLETRVQERTNELELAARVARRVSAITTLDDLLQQIVDETRRTFDLYSVLIATYDNDTQTINLRIGAGDHGTETDNHDLHVHIDAQPSIIAAAARERRIRVLNDVSHAPEYLPLPQFPATQSELVAPLVVGNKLLGVLDIQAAEKDRFDDDDIRAFDILAQQIAIAIENARLYADQVYVANELRRLVQLRNRFLANISHELRTPLNSIINFTEFVIEGVYGDINQTQADSLKKVVHSSEHLLALINDMLDVTKIEAGMMELFITEVDIATTLHEAIDTVSGLLGNKPVTLNTDITPDLPVLHGDKRRLRQVFVNLIGNAIKFTEEGHVTVTAKATDDHHITITVADSGIGIDPDEYDTIFEPFQRTKRSREHVGTGLGLAISKSMTEAHNGHISFVSNIGEGTTFTLLLPLENQLEMSI